MKWNEIRNVDDSRLPTEKNEEEEVNNEIQ